MRSKAILLLFVTLICGTSCGKKEEHTNEHAGVSKGRVGNAASFAAEAFVEAARECKIVGIPDLKACSESDGILASEVTAKMLARQAYKMEKRYADMCNSAFPPDFCGQLLERAKTIEWRRPPRSEADIESNLELDDKPHHEL